MANRISLFGCLAIAALSHGYCASADAAEMSINGSVLSIQGEIRPGDQYRFKDLLAGAAPSSVAYVDLVSGGGSIEAAAEIGRQIRAAGLTTVVDGSKERCASSCGLIFLSGARRIYLNAGAASGVTGLQGFHGLGFHQGSDAITHNYSADGTAQQIAVCHEFGSPQAAALVAKASPVEIYGLSGETALAMGIATALTMK